MFEDRIFTFEVAEPQKIAAVDNEHDARLFAGLTQEQVEMDRRVNIEHQEMLQAVAAERAAREAADTNLAETLDLLSQVLQSQDDRITALEEKIKTLSST